MKRVLFFTPIFNFQSQRIRENHEHIIKTSENYVEFFSIVGASPEHAKSIAYKEFLKSGCDYFFNVDADIFFFEGEDNPIDKLIEQDKDIVAGIYTLKVPPYRPAHRTIDLQEYYEKNKDFPKDYKFIVPNELHEIMFSSGGCMMIKKEVIKKLMDKYDVPNLPMIHAKEYLSEDFAFCWRAKKEGYKIYALPEIKLGHCGNYYFSLEDYNKFTNI